MYILGIILGCALVPINVLGLPQLTSNIGSQLSEEYCPGSVTITCNALGFGRSDLIDWYINDTLLARYTYASNHIFPFAVMVNTSLNAVAQISSSSFTNSQFNFENFTLSVDLDDLLPFQGQNITCGTLAERSNVFIINTFEILEGILNISYVAKYQGIGGELMEIEVQWIDRFEMVCEVTTAYIVQLESSNGITLNKTLSTQDCTNTLCSVQFTSSLDKTAESYTVIITAYNSLFNDTFTSDTIMNSTGNLINYGMCNNSASVKCSNFSNENCSMYSTDMGSPVLIKPGDAYLVTFDMSPQNIEITIHSNSTISVQSHNFTVGYIVNEAMLGIGVAVFIVGFFLLILGYGVGIVVFCKHQNNKDDYWFMWMVTLVFSIIAMVIFIVTLILWSLVGAYSSSASCLNEETYPPILIAAVALSFILILLGVVMLGGFVIAFQLKCKCLTIKDTKEQFIVYNVEFGEKAPKVRDRNTQECSICHQQYANVQRNEGSDRKFIYSSEKHFVCSTCNESVCDKCSKMVYVKHCKEEKKVCNSCYKVYQDEQKMLSGLQFGKHKPPKSPHSEECYECGETNGQTSKKGNTAEDPLCSTCGHWVCDKCFDEHEVEVDYLPKKMKVCKNCYAIYKMTVEDVNKEKKQQVIKETTVASTETATIINESMV